MNDNIKILFYIGTLSASGGTQRMLCLLCNLLIDYFDITILVHKSGDSFFDLNENVKVIELNGNLLQKNIQIYKILKKTKSKYYINLDSNSVLFNGFFLPSFTKLIIWEHFSIQNNYKKWLFTLSRKYAVWRAYKFILLTENEVKLWNEKYELSKNKCTVILNPLTIPIENINTSNKFDYKTILAIGNNINVKGFDLLIEAWKQIETDWKLKIVGLSEVEINELQTLINESNIENVTLFPRSDIETFYKQSSVFVLSSRKEAAPLVLIESQSYGIPIIAFDHLESVKEILNDSGIIADFSNPINSLIKKINAITLDKNLYNEYHLKSLENAKLFSLDSFKEKWMNVLK